MVIERKRLSLFVRSFPGWNPLRAAIAKVTGLPIEEVRGLTENVDPVVRIEALACVIGFHLRVELYIDPKRVVMPAVEQFAVEFARELDEDVAHHDGSLNPYAYVLVQPGGERFLVYEQADTDADGLLLDESPGYMRPLPRWNIGHT